MPMGTKLGTTGLGIYNIFMGRGGEYYRIPIINTWREVGVPKWLKK